MEDQDVLEHGLTGSLTIERTACEPTSLKRMPIVLNVAEAYARSYSIKTLSTSQFGMISLSWRISSFVTSVPQQ